MLRGLDSNQRPIDYTCPNITKRGGLYHPLYATPKLCSPGRIRTSDQSLNKSIAAFTPYQLSAPQVGFEPTTNRLTGDRSTAELLRSRSLVLGPLSYQRIFF